MHLPGGSLNCSQKKGPWKSTIGDRNIDVHKQEPSRGDQRRGKERKLKVPTDENFKQTREEVRVQHLRSATI